MHLSLRSVFDVVGKEGPHTHTHTRFVRRTSCKHTAAAMNWVQAFGCLAVWVCFRRDVIVLTLGYITKKERKV